VGLLILDISKAMIEEVRLVWEQTALCLCATLKSPDWESMGFSAPRLFLASVDALIVWWFLFVCL